MSLTKFEEQAMTPTQLIAQGAERADTTIGIAVEWAKRLKRVIDEQHLFVEVKGKKHIIAEGWATMVALDHAGYDSPSDMIKELKDGKGETVGYLATTYIMKDGVRIAGATQACYFDDPPCRGKDGGSKDRAAISTAQTWAGVKAGRMHYGWIVVMAGYAATPAEEMTNDKETPVDKTKHWCEQHQVNFFKSGRMRGYAHKIEGTEQWCNEPIERVAEGQSKPAEQVAKPQDKPMDTPKPVQADIQVDNRAALLAMKPATIGEMLLWATDPTGGLGYRNRLHVLTTLGIKETTEIVSVEDSWRALVTKKYPEAKEA